jgi:FMN phosphatase YigB (HAD superfamily)
MSTEISHLVLDAQGVTFNAPLEQAFKKISIQLGFDEDELSLRWCKRYRKLAWLGMMNDDDLIAALTDNKMPREAFLVELERNFELGPVASEIKKWSSLLPVWILSNHRSEWLYNRLDKFSLSQYIDKVFVSEEIGLLKPQPEAFNLLIKSKLVPERTLFLDDQLKNIRGASKFNMQTFIVKDKSVIKDVNDILLR